MNAVQIQPATEEQIAEFKVAAAAAYKALNIPADTAEYLFTRFMNKAARQMGLVVEQPVVKQAAPTPSPKIMKLAAQLKAVVA